jgi:hypothetical protein
VYGKTNTGIKKAVGVERLKGMNKDEGKTD